MLTAWVLLTLAISALVALGARLIEGALLEVSAPTRWPWIAGLFAAPLIGILPLLPGVPALRALLPGSGGATGGEAAAEVGSALVTGVAALPAGIQVGPDHLLATFDPWVLALWAGGVLLLGGYGAALSLRLARARMGWTPVRLPEGEVLVSDDTGPAVLGLFRTEIVLPRWCLSLPANQRALILAHENEHRSAHDTTLVGAGALALLLMPWNLPAWWMWQRLRTAVEVDCDARVTRRVPGDRRTYGDLLLLVGARPSMAPTPLTTFSKSRSSLGRRIHMLTRTRSRYFLPRALLLSLLGVGLIVVACLVPGPDDSEGLTDPSFATVQTGPDASGELAQSPQFTPHDESPTIRNSADVRDRLSEAYPSMLRDNGIGGTVMVHVFIDTEGVVHEAQIVESSGHAALDDAGLDVARTMEFTPARNRGETVPVWIQVPINFSLDGAETQESPELVPEGSEPEPVAAPDAEDAAQPHFTPHDEAPTIRNSADVRDRLSEAYPSMLRDNGIGGTVMVHVFIDTEGVVHEAQIVESSGHAALDDAGLDVARTMEFTPARNRGETVPVWIQVPINFSAR